MKNNKTVHSHLNTPMIISNICGIIIYFCSFTNIENVMCHFYYMLGGLMFFIFNFIIIIFIMLFYIPRSAVKTSINQ